MSTLFQPGLIQPGLAQQPGEGQPLAPTWYLACFDASVTPTWNRADISNGRNGWSATGYVTSGTGTAPSSGSGDDANVGITLTGDFSGGPYKLWLIWDDGNQSSNLVSSQSWSTSTLLSGSGQIIVTLTGDLFTQIKLLVSAQVESTATGAITTQIKLLANAQVESTATGAITTQIKLLANAQAETTANGTLSDLSQILLAGAAQTETAVTGNITTQIKLLAETQSQATASGTLSDFSQALLSGQLVSEITVNGALTAQIKLAAGAQSQATASAPLTAMIRLAAGAQGETISVASLTVASSAIFGSMICNVTATGVLTGGSSPQMQVHKYGLAFDRRIFVW